MTDRERWTVYPLLFLALGISLKDKLTRSVNTDEVRCKAVVCDELFVSGPRGADSLHVVGGNLRAKSLIVADANGKQRVQIGSGSVQATNMICSALLVTDADGKQRVNVANGGVQAASMICNALVVAGANGKEAAAISANEHGGFVRTTGVETGTISFLGNTEQIAGLLFIDSHGAIHPGPIFASPVSAKKPADSESPSPEAPDTPATPEAEPETPTPDETEKSDPPAPADQAPAESSPSEKADAAQPE